MYFKLIRALTISSFLLIGPTIARAESSPHVYLDPGATFSVRLSKAATPRPRFWIGPSLSVDVWPDRFRGRWGEGTTIAGVYTSAEIAGDGTGARFQFGLQGIIAPIGIEAGPAISWDHEATVGGLNTGMFASAGVTWLGIRCIFDSRGVEVDLTGGAANHVQNLVIG